MDWLTNLKTKKMQSLKLEDLMIQFLSSIMLSTPCFKNTDVFIKNDKEQYLHPWWQEIKTTHVCKLVFIEKSTSILPLVHQMHEDS